MLPSWKVCTSREVVIMTVCVQVKSEKKNEQREKTFAFF